MALPIAFTASLLTFIVLDAAWLILVGIGQFQAQIGSILRPQPDLGAAAAFYATYAVGLMLLAVRPALQQRSLGCAATNGAVLGLTAYATFDLTSLAVIKGWTWELALLDMAWGTALSCAAAASGYWAGMRADRR